MIFTSLSIIEVSLLFTDLLRKIVAADNRCHLLYRLLASFRFAFSLARPPFFHLSGEINGHRE